MTDRFAAHAFVRDDDGKIHSFAPGDKVPSWAADHITNTALIAQTSDESDADRAARKAAKKAAKAAAEAKAAEQAEAAAERAAREAADRSATQGSDQAAQPAQTPPNDDEQAATAESTAESLPKPPPKSGAGSSRDAWADYAQKAAAARGLAIEIEAGDGRDDIINGLQQAGIPTEE